MEPSQFLKKMHVRIIRNFLDILVLAELCKGPLSGYDVMGFIHRRYHLLISSGSVYAVLFTLERKGLISGVSTQRKRVYRLTETGQKTVRAIMKTNDRIWHLVLSLLKEEKRLQGN